jgi:hypothetical protein
VRSVRMSLSQPIVAERSASIDFDADGVVEGVVEGTVASIAGTTAALPNRGLSLVPTDADVTANFEAWLTRTDVATAECSKWAKTVPPARADATAAEARRRAEVWLDFARALDRHAATAT